MTTIRSKFKLVEIHQLHWSQTARRLVFQAEYDEKIPEDQRFQKATPSGRFEMTVDNPSALGLFKLGDCYYFDASPVPSH